MDQLCSDEEPVPKAVMELLLHLFRYGPNTTGIFRKSANAKTAKEVKLELDEGERGKRYQIGITVFTCSYVISVPLSPTY